MDLLGSAGDRWSLPPALRTPSFLLPFFALISFACFTRFYGCFDSLWADEISVARVLFSDLGVAKYVHHPLYHRPLGHLLITELLGNIYNNELMLRLQPLAFSIGTIFIGSALVWVMTTDRLATMLSAYLITVNPVLSGYAKEFKPYAIESFFFAALLFFSYRFFQRPNRTRSWTLGLCALAAVMLGFPTVFMVFGLGLVLCYRVARRQTEALWPALSLCVLSGAYFILQYIFISSHTPNIVFPEMARFTPNFGSGFSLVELFSFSARATYDVLARASYLIPFPRSDHVSLARLVFIPLGLGVAVGTISLIRRRRAEAIIFITPFLCALALSWLSKWMFGSSRTNTWAVAGVLCIAIYGWSILLKGRRPWIRAIAFLFLAVAATPWSLSTITQRQSALMSPEEAWKDTANTLLSQPLEDDEVIAYGFFAWDYGLRYYSQIWANKSVYADLAARDDVRLPSYRQGNKLVEAAKKTLRTHPRTTFFLYHFTPRDTKAVLTAAKETGATRIQTIRRPGCLVLRYVR